MNRTQLDKQELLEHATQSKRLVSSRTTFILLGAAIGIVIPFVFALVFNERSWDEYADYYGPGFARIQGLFVDFLIPVSVSGVAGAATGLGLWCAVSSHIAVRFRIVAVGALIGVVIANLIAVVMFSSELFECQSKGEPAYVDDVLRDVVWLVICPTVHGAWIGALLTLAIASTFARRGVGPVGGALGTAIFAAVLSTTVMLVIMLLTAPQDNYHGGAGIGPGAGHAIVFWFCHLFIVLPISIIVGACVGWRVHRSP